ncbi:MAG: metalloregulator ArsR/SmtB family transcription factor [Methanobacteriaceae archaeon]|nr:metalloregulator ArsR/SmtB family transcription factor [Methanobacteriaceae archaeon]
MENEKKVEDLEEIFKALSNPNRLKIIYIISKKENKSTTVTEITKTMKITQPAASQHLKILKTVKILESKKEGNNIYYKINDQTVSTRKKEIDTLFTLILK